MSSSKVTLIFIPAYNEADNIAQVVNATQAQLPDADLLVVDDGSTDDTVAVALAAGASVASLPFNQGLGAALQTGYLEAKRGNYAYCAHLDADGQHRPEDLQMLLEAVKEDECDLAVGSRYLDQQALEEAVEGMYKPNLSRNLGSVLFRQALSAVTGHRFTDTTSGLRAANRKIIDQFSAVYAPDYAELESLQRSLALGLRVREYPVVMLERFSGKSKIGFFASLHFTFKSTLVLLIGSLRRRRDNREQAK